MLNWIFLVVAIGTGGGESSTGSATVTAVAPVATNNNAEQVVTQAGGGGFGTDEEAAVAPKYVAESQVSLGKFTTATEIKPILTTTKGSWVAIREYDGQDLLYFTHLMSWRCGLVAVQYSVNGGPMVEWPLAECHVDAGWANAITPEDGLVYGAYALGSLQSVDVEVIFDDLSTDNVSFGRNEILMP